MGRKRTPGLIKRNGIWHIDKQVRGRRLRESTGESSLEKAEEYLARRLEEICQATVFGIRAKRTFREAAHKYVKEATKVTIDQDIIHIRMLDPFIGRLPLEGIHKGSLIPFIEARKKEGVKNRTINYGVQTVRRILNAAAGEWVDEYGMTWLQSAPKIKLLSENDRRAPYPLSWDEQEALFAELPEHLMMMALYGANTGCREKEITSLKWDWETYIPELGVSVFILPPRDGAERIVKNGEERVVVLNDIAQDVIEKARGAHPVYVFTYKGKKVTKMNNSAWKRARKIVGLPQARVHDLRHTFARRLRAAGVSFEDRQDLLGHRSGRITTHYSSAELRNLIEAVNRICVKNPHKSPALVVLRRRAS